MYFRSSPDLSVCLCLQLTVRLKDICSMTKEKTARLIPNAIQLCTDNEKVRDRLKTPTHRCLCVSAFLAKRVVTLLCSLPQHFFTSFGARDRTYMMMFRLWQNALLDKVSETGMST